MEFLVCRMLPKRREGHLHITHKLPGSIYYWNCLKSYIINYTAWRQHWIPSWLKLRCKRFISFVIQTCIQPWQIVDDHIPVPLNLHWPTLAIFS